MNVTLKEKEKTAVKDLQTQEKSCMEKYRRYEQEAKDPVLKDLFHQLHLKRKSIMIPLTSCFPVTARNATAMMRTERIITQRQLTLP